jgi:predicted transcriptional regulator
MTDPKVVTTIRLDPAQKAALDVIGERLDRSRSWLLRKAVDEFVERHTKAKEGGS